MSKSRRTRLEERSTGRSAPTKGRAGAPPCPVAPLSDAPESLVLVRDYEEAPVQTGRASLRTPERQVRALVEALADGDLLDRLTTGRDPSRSARVVAAASHVVQEERPRGHGGRTQEFVSGDGVPCRWRTFNVNHDWRMSLAWPVDGPRVVVLARLFESTHRRGRNDSRYDPPGRSWRLADRLAGTVLCRDNGMRRRVMPLFRF